MRKTIGFASFFLVTVVGGLTVSIVSLIVATNETSTTHLKPDSDTSKQSTEPKLAQHQSNEDTTLSNENSSNKQQQNNQPKLKLQPVDRPKNVVPSIHNENQQVTIKCTNGNNDTDYCQDTLRQVAIVHRHGDRTVVDFSPKDPLVNEPFWYVHGLGQLTNRGKERLYLLGSLMRRRYAQFLGNSINKNHRVTRSSGTPRCIESAQVFLSSFLALDAKPKPSDADLLFWDDKSKIKLGSMWQPASVMTTSASIDGMLAESSVCKTLEEEYKVFDDTEAARSLLRDYSNVVDVLREQYGFVIDAFYKWFWASSFIEVERSYFEQKVPKEILNVYDQLQAAGNKAFVIYQSSKTARRLRSGLLINDIVSHMEAAIAGHDASKQLLHYSGHDLTNVGLLGVLDSFEQHQSRPDYASSIMFELHRDTHHIVSRDDVVGYEDDNNGWFVQVFYMPKVPGEIYQLELTKCKKNAKNRCSFEAFKELIEQYRIPSWYQWMQECKNDMSQVDPYKI